MCLSVNEPIDHNDALEPLAVVILTEGIVSVPVDYFPFTRPCNGLVRSRRPAEALRILKCQRLPCRRLSGHTPEYDDNRFSCYLVVRAEGIVRITFDNPVL